MCDPCLPSSFQRKRSFLFDHALRGRAFIHVTYNHVTWLYFIKYKHTYLIFLLGHLDSLQQLPWLKDVQFPDFLHFFWHLFLWRIFGENHIEKSYVDAFRTHPMNSHKLEFLMKHSLPFSPWAFQWIFQQRILSILIQKMFSFWLMYDVLEEFSIFS